LLLVVLSFIAIGVTCHRVVADRDEALAGTYVAGYFGAFLLFAAGFSIYARSGARGTAAPRFALAGALFLGVVGPWIAMAIAGIFDNGERAMLVASPSPAYAVHAYQEIASAGSNRDLVALAGAVSAAGWALLGLGLVAVAAGRIGRRLAPAPPAPPTPPATAATVPAPEP
jgi:hypothetical protein